MASICPTSIVTNPDSTMGLHFQTAASMLSADPPPEDRVAVIGHKAPRVHLVQERVELLGPRHYSLDPDQVRI